MTWKVREARLTNYYVRETVDIIIVLLYQISVFQAHYTKVAINGTISNFRMNCAYLKHLI